MRLFTARYYNRFVKRSGFAPVRITLGAPKNLWYPLADTVVELAPSGFQFTMEDREQFRRSYRHKLYKLTLEWITKRLGGISREQSNENLVLLCYEDLRKPDQWCHRTTFAGWWKDQTGNDVIELPEEWDDFAALMKELGLEERLTAKLERSEPNQSLFSRQLGFAFAA